MEGVKVLDFGTYLAGPLLCRHLSGLGCEVTCVLRPPHCRGVEEESRRLPNVHSELRKTAARCVQIDLPTERQLALQLVSETDLLVENFGAGVMERLGIGYDECVSVNPSLLYVSMPGFPDDGEEHPPAFESALLASAGVFRDMGLNRRLLGVEASYTHLPLASVYGSVHALFATLVTHHSDQRPSHLVVPLLSALSETMVHNSKVRASHFVETARSDERAPGLQFVHHVDHPVGSVQIVARHCLRGLSLPDDDTAHAPKYGAHTRALLPAPLLAEGVAADAWSRCYIPFSTPCDSCHLRGRRRYLHSSCAHSVCIRCRKEASCPVCGAPCLDAKVWTRWKTEYSNWRRGKSKGAKGELAARSSSSTPRERRARSAPP